ncbi:hypothetical protein [Piscinibacter sp. XHJ-5]|uniref:hypothetical protein n=1 Tax=Piscinibacter sp. XHJ-5 TaxID=3037797 RepID=UPI0024531FFF|nr:hypothetical protein [Piscinibacter sp. XHJ-5]
MRFSESLSSYLASRPDKSLAFYLGHWLAAIADEELDGLRRLLVKFRDGDQSTTTDDLLSVVIIARSGELHRPDHRFDPDVMLTWLGVLYIAVSVETYRRRGWVVLMRPLSIQPHKRVRLSLTEEGLRHASEFAHGLFDASG